MFDCVQLLHFFFENLNNQTFDSVRLVMPGFSYSVWNSSSLMLETNLPLPNNCSRAIEVGVKCLFSVFYSLILTHVIPCIHLDASTINTYKHSLLLQSIENFNPPGNKQQSGQWNFWRLACSNCHFAWPQGCSNSQPLSIRCPSPRTNIQLQSITVRALWTEI